MTTSAYERFVDEIVTVTKGPHAGKTGYCDDVDDGVIIYPGSFMDGYIVVRASHVRLASKRAAATYQWRFMSTPKRFYSKTA